KDSQNRIWLSSQNYGLFCIEDKKVRKYNLMGLNIQQIQETPEGHLFFATNWNGIGSFNPSTGQYQRIKSSENETLPNSVSQLIHFGSHSLLEIGDNGLFIYDYKQNKLSLPQSDPLQNGNQQF